MRCYENDMPELDCIDVWMDDTGLSRLELKCAAMTISHIFLCQQFSLNSSNSVPMY